MDAAVACGILLAEVFVLATMWIAQPVGWIWLGSQLNHETNSVSAGLVVTFVGMILTMIGTIWVAMRIDHAWKLARRAAGHRQKEGALNRLFVASGLIAWIVFELWFYVVERAFVMPFLPNT